MKESPKKERRIAGALFQLIAGRLRNDVDPANSISIIDQPSPADVARAHELIEQHNWTHLRVP